MMKARKLLKLTGGVRLWRDERGQVAIITGLMLLVLIGAAGLVIDGSMVFFEHRGNRNVADAAALAATRAIWQTGTANAFSGPCTGFPFALADVDAACTMATSSPFNRAPGQVRVNIPPNEGPLAGSPGHVQVVVTTQRPTFLMRVLGFQQITVPARAVAGAIPTSSPYAIYALSPNACEGLKFGGPIQLNVVGGIKVNASCENPPTDALETSSGTTISVTGPIDVVGGVDTANATFTGSLPAQDTDPVPDPLGKLSEVVTNWADTNFDGMMDAALLTSECTDARCTATYAAGYGGVLLADVGVVGGSLRIPYYNPATLQDPSLGPYNACSAPMVDHGPGYGLMPTLFPGVYPGGITMSNCSAYWERGVYVLAGRKNNGAASLEVTPSSNYRAVAPNGILIYVTEDPFATNPQRRPAGPIQFHTAGGSGGSSIVMSALPGVQCPPRGYEDILLFVDREGAYSPGDCNTTTGGCQNRVEVWGGGFLTSLSGTLYDRTGAFDGTGSYTLANSQLVFNVVIMQNGNAAVTCIGSSGTGPLLPRLRE